MATSDTVTEGHTGNVAHGYSDKDGHASTSSTYHCAYKAGLLSWRNL